MLQDIENQSARSLLRRQLSSNPSTPPTSHRKGSKAIKGNVGGTSPHSIQRRRTTASHTGRANHFMAQDSSYQRHSKQQGSNHRATNLLPQSRPVSWHPNSRSFDTSSGYFPSSEPALRNTIAGLQSLAVTSAGPTSAESPLRNPIPAGPEPAVHHPSTTTTNTTGGFHGEFSNMNPPIVYPSQPSYAWPNQYPDYMSDAPPPYDGSFYPSVHIQQPDWSQISDYAAYIPSQTPDYLPLQCPSKTTDPLALGYTSQLPKKRSKELVGMGLYDNPDDDVWSEVDYSNASYLCHLGIPHRESTGKGLKLEETWEPPKDQDAAEDEEAYSSDDGEEDLPVVPPMEQDPPSFYSPYADLSNQSFFFENDDQYSGCVMLDPGVQACQPRYSDPARENFLWF